jgi:type II secretion system protein J
MGKPVSDIPCKSKNALGFTFIELMVTVVIFSLVMSAAYMTFSSSLSAWHRGEEEMATYQDVRKVLEIMSAELRSSFLSPRDQSIKFSGFAEAKGEYDTARVTFFRAPVITKSSRYQHGLYKVTYYVDTDKINGEPALYRKETPGVGKFLFGSEKIQQVLIGIEGFDIEYYSTEGWRDTWDSRRHLPKKVRVTLAMSKKGYYDKPTVFSIVTDIPQGSGEYEVNHDEEYTGLPD